MLDPIDEMDQLIERYNAGELTQVGVMTGLGRIVGRLRQENELLYAFIGRLRGITLEEARTLGRQAIADIEAKKARRTRTG